MAVARVIRLRHLLGWRPWWYLHWRYGRKIREAFMGEVLTALAWYADSKNWRVIVCDTEIVDGHVVRTFEEPPVRMDAGGRARSALLRDSYLAPEWWGKREKGP